ncbi:type II toxin-antitoxin system VapC family toxin [Emcibacter nanhaiensis]|uniref:Ribonuclease VapC n=1 Tax=Emcibacter nanhaiensis TaxID=1505037 RepID=A0A501PB92_9PROT|nr:type II toxin-antitoxin system VapC family toxin [Emcibacter nanhaiensis]TPD57307.1 type II toxin-antitoxin system VapC family toxin [Emcibacter nanhaiensis]
MIAVDTSAIMALLLGEEGVDRISDCLTENDLCISAGTLSELLIVAASRGLGEEAEALISTLGVEIVIVDGAVARQVQQAYTTWGKGQHPAGLNFGDCFAYALAMGRKIPLLYVGNDFGRTDIKPAFRLK